MSKKSDKKKEMTQNEKIILSIIFVFLGFILVLFFIYFQSSVLYIILKSTTNSEFLKKNLPTDDKIYDRTSNSTASNKSISGGGNELPIKEKKSYLDPLRPGLPYSWIGNENIVLHGIGHYFKTFFQTQRGMLSSFLQGVRDIFYEEYKKPSTTQESVFDYLKFTFALPFLASLLYIGNNISSLCILFWGAVNNQSWLLIPLLILAFVVLFLGILNLYFWPIGFFAIYLSLFILKLNEGKKQLFVEYGKRYKWLWFLKIILFWFVSISWTWNWHPNAMLVSGGIPLVLLALTLFGIKTIL